LVPDTIKLLTPTSTALIKVKFELDVKFTKFGSLNLIELILSNSFKYKEYKLLLFDVIEVILFKIVLDEVKNKFVLST
jgi:hypothetical protein